MRKKIITSLVIFLFSVMNAIAQGLIFAVLDGRAIILSVITFFICAFWLIVIYGNEK